MTVYNTKSIKPEHRDLIPNYTQFNLCEDCLGINTESQMTIRFYSRYKLALCDACVDCRDGLKWHNKRDFSHRQVK